MLAEIIPTRILGDPMQAVFWNINVDYQVTWAAVLSDFKQIEELTIPYRWKGKNVELGQWLLDVRERLKTGNPIELCGSPASWRSNVRQQEQLGQLISLARKTHQSVLGLRKWSNNCHYMARYLNGSYASMETVECEDLQEWARKLETSNGLNRISNIIDFAGACFSRIPSAIKQLGMQFSSGKMPNPRRLDYRLLVERLKNVIHNNDIQLIGQALEAIRQLDEKPVNARRELWHDMRRSIDECRRSEGRTLSETAWHIRNRSRHIGRRVDRRCISTTLLVKGLQFDHVVILNADEFDDAESLYVAMTRGSMSLTVLSGNSTLERPKPHFVQC